MVAVPSGCQAVRWGFCGRGRRAIAASCRRLWRTCEAALALEAAQRIFAVSKGHYEAAVRLIEDGEVGTWTNLVARLRAGDQDDGC